MSVKSASSHGEPGGGPVIRCGYLKKLKTSKKKFFVLRTETSESSARFEYYDSEKKFNSGQAPKRSIPLKTCFNINKRHDTKHKHVIALYTKDDCFCVLMENEEDLDAWLKALLSQQQGEEVAEGETPRPTFEHVWQATVLNRGLGATPLICGSHRLCLTDKTLSLIRIDCDTPRAKLSLSSIRSCGSLKNFFYLEAGRSSGIGAGELWMEMEDANIAQNVYQTVYHAMTSNSNSREELAPRIRDRSFSVTESSKPNNKTIRQMHAGTPKPIPYQHDHILNDSPAPCTSTNNTAAGNVAWSGTVNHQRTRSLPLAQPAPITTETLIHPPRAAKRPANHSSKYCRTRCDSMPSRPRTTSEGNHPIPVWDKVTGFLMPHKPQIRDISHSPPSGSPGSPPSVACSTDSAGSSLSIDESSEPWHEMDMHRTRFQTSLTPDEAIVEENNDDCTDSRCVISPIPGHYMPMSANHQPISSDDGYVDMSPRGRHTTMSPAASMSSVTSGTPSTDMRFAEYQLDKVTSYFTPSEEEETSSADRPRTYSMGSKPYKTRMEQARDRAWSVGSKSKKGYSRVLPPHGPHNHPSTKSSSAPMLSNTRLHSSHSSIGPMEDLMEMDFSKKCPPGYVEMKPNTKISSGYVDMRPGHIERPPDTSPYVEMRSGSSPAKPIYTQADCNRESSRSDYLDMDFRRSNSTRFYTSPISPISSIASTSPSSNYNHSDYIDMDYHTKNTNSPQHSDLYISSPVKTTLSLGSQGSPSSIDYIDMDYSGKSENDYMEMSLGKSNNQSDYTNMSLGFRNKDKKKKEKTRSQPIMIQNAVPPSQKNSGTSPIYSILPGRKNSTGTPPKMYLPLQTSTYSSLPRQRTRKNSRRDSKDSSSSSITTPSSSSTIFPISLNSPSSPIYPISKNPKVDTPRTIKEVNYTCMDFEKKDTSDYVNYCPAVPKTSTRNYDTGDYAVMKPGTLDVRVPQSNTCIVSAQISTLDLNESKSFVPIAESVEESKDSKTEKRVLSRPSSLSSDSKSSSSEVGSTTSTLVGSRPASVNSDNIRTASTDCNQLHYVSLDLVSVVEEEPNRSPRTPKLQHCESQSSLPETGFTYAKIDFVRSEGLKNNQLLNNNNAKVNH